MSPQRSSPLPNLSWKGTFIDTLGNDANSELSPRALSDPGSASSSYSSHFADEQAYILTLAARTARYFSNVGVGNKQGIDSTHPSDAMSNNKSFTDQKLMLSDCSTCSGIAGAVSYGNATPTQNFQLHRDELTCHIRSKSQTSNQQLSHTLVSIYEIPEQVNEILQLAASELVEDVSNEVSKACRVLGDSDAKTRTDAADQVQGIPEMVVASFEDSFAKATSHVRTHVEDVMHTLKQNRMRDDEVVEQLMGIQAEVQEITCQAVKEASLVVQDRVVRLLDHVLPTIFEEEQRLALFQAKQNIVESLPQTLPEAVRRSGEVVKYNVESASVLVAEKGLGHDGYIKNRVVADTLLRAKVSDALQGETMLNPGSRGHPEFCSRICIYFAKGSCTNGSSCAFCHAPYDRRPTHLDKRHRSMIKSLDFMEFFELIYPVLKSKFEDTDLDQCDQIVKDACAKLSQTCGPSNRGKKMSKACRSLQASLKALSARTLLGLLCRSPPPEYNPHHTAINDFVSSTKQYLLNEGEKKQPLSSEGDMKSTSSRLSWVSRDGDWWRLV